MIDGFCYFYYYYYCCVDFIIVIAIVLNILYYDSHSTTPSLPLSPHSDTVYNIQSIREDYFNLIGLRDMEISAAMRKILTYFRLPGEAQKIERILESFAKVYFQVCCCGGGSGGGDGFN